jgi:hypothetical protein
MVEYPGDVRLFINGSYAEGAGEARQQVRSPVSGEGIGSVPVPVQADIDAAGAAASAAQGRWGRVGVWDRAKICHAIGDALMARCEELSRLQTLEQVGGGDELWAGLDLDRAVAAGRLDELPGRPSGCRLDPAGNGGRGEDDRQVGLDGVALAVVDGAGLEVCF